MPEDPKASILDYAATKGAIVTFTKGLAQELIGRGIRVNCVAPGPVWTPLLFGARIRSWRAAVGATGLLVGARPALAALRGEFYPGPFHASTAGDGGIGVDEVGLHPDLVELRSGNVAPPGPGLLHDGRGLDGGGDASCEGGGEAQRTAGRRRFISFFERFLNARGCEQVRSRGALDGAQRLSTRAVSFRVHPLERQSQT